MLLLRQRDNDIALPHRNTEQLKREHLALFVEHRVELEFLLLYRSYHPALCRHMCKTLAIRELTPRQTDCARAGHSQGATGTGNWYVHPRRRALLAPVRQTRNQLVSAEDAVGVLLQVIGNPLECCLAHILGVCRSWAHLCDLCRGVRRQFRAKVGVEVYRWVLALQHDLTAEARAIRCHLLF